MNAIWLNQLVEQNKNVLRFEDFFISFQDTVDKIEKKFGKFKNEFKKPLSFFYPEKCERLFSYL